MNLPRSPGLLTDEDLDTGTLDKLRRAGFNWLAPQVQNADQVKDRDLQAIRASGFWAPVWGVTYSPDRFFAEGKLLAEQAIRLGADHLIMDVEQAAKNTRDSRGLKPIVDGARAGGWTRPVHLNTMGPPHGENDYAIDTTSFLETGGGVFTQAHANETPAFRPSLAVRYWVRVGVPLERLNIQISVYPSESDKETPHVRLSGPHWGQLLLEAGQGRAFSVFRAEGMNDEDVRSLSPLTVLPAPSTPPPQPPPPSPPTPPPNPPAKALKLKRPLVGGEKGADVRHVQRALNRWVRDPKLALKVTREFDPATSARLKSFQNEQGISEEGLRQKTLTRLAPQFDDFGRNGYAAFKPGPGKPEIPQLGPIVKGGQPILDQDCTHITDNLGWPAFDDGWPNPAGKDVIAPEPCVVDDDTSSAQGGDAFYVKGASGIRYWVAHITTVPKLGTKFRKGQKMTTISRDHARPHVHLAINVMPLIGRHLDSHDNYTHGAGLIGSQLEKAL